MTVDTDARLNQVFTYGYTGSYPEHLKQTSDLFGATVLDIRRAARSMSPKWRKGALVDLLGDAYVHDSRLGNVNYKDRDKPIEFLDLEGGIDGLVELLLEKPVILLCGCQDYRGCHRTELAEIMAERYGVDFNHL